MDVTQDGLRTCENGEAPTLPGWYTADDMEGFNQYMWVDEGTHLDFNKNDGNQWNSEGFDAEKHVFFTKDGSCWKIRDRGKDTTWS